MQDDTRIRDRVSEIKRTVAVPPQPSISEVQNARLRSRRSGQVLVGSMLIVGTLALVAFGLAA